MNSSKMKFLTIDIIPCWYEMAWRGWQGEEPAILLRVHKDFVQNTPPVPANAPIVEQLKYTLNLNTLFDTFAGNFNAHFGFNNAFERLGESGEFVEFRVPIPVIDKPTGRKCGECKSVKRDEFLNGECFYCNGRGEEYQIDWRLAYSLSASFTIFTTIAHYPKIETSSPLPQLLTMQTITLPDMHGGELNGEYSIPLCDWMSRVGSGGHTKVTPMAYAMKTSYQKMFGRRESDDYHFQAYIENDSGWLNVSCPGDGCGLAPSYGEVKRGEGYEFSSHNVDTPMQQITLIAGLAALYEKARRDIALYGSG